jgi:uncharacterized membrane protein
MTFPLIPADADFALLGILLGCVGFGFWAERKTRWGRRATGILITMTAAMILANLKIIPTDAPTYHVIWDMLLPVALPLLLFRADLSKAVEEAGPTLLAFGFGVIGILAGTLVAVYLVPLGDLTSPMAGMFSATYIGGGANFAAVAATIDFQQGGPYIAAIAADNIATNLVTLFLIALPGITMVSKYFENKHAAGGDARVIHMDDSIYRIENVDLVGLAMGLTAAFVLAALGMVSADLIGKPSFAILFTTAYALALANLAPAFVGRFSGDFEAGIFLIFIFLAALAASADVWVLFDIGPRLFLFAGVILTVHLTLILGLGKWAKLDISEIIIGSTACVGGVTSATAIASAKGWPNLMTPGIIVGTIGNSFGTFIGVWVWSLFS